MAVCLSWWWSLARRILFGVCPTAWVLKSLVNLWVLSEGQMERWSNYMFAAGACHREGVAGPSLVYGWCVAGLPSRSPDRLGSRPPVSHSGRPAWRRWRRVDHLAIVTHSSRPPLPQVAEVCSVSRLALLPLTSSELPRKGRMT